MTVEELINLLNRYPAHFEVRIAEPEHRNILQYEVYDTKSSTEIGIRDFVEGETELGADEENPDKLVDVPVTKEENANVVWLLEGSQIGYCPRAVFEY